MFKFLNSYIKNIYFILVAMWFIVLPTKVYADFSRVLEFELMSECVGNVSSVSSIEIKKRKIKICSCALDETINARFFGKKYTDDEDYAEHLSEFIDDFDKNINHYLKNPSKCDEIK